LARQDATSLIIHAPFFFFFFFLFLLFLPTFDVDVVVDGHLEDVLADAAFHLLALAVGRHKHHCHCLGCGRRPLKAMQAMLLSADGQDEERKPMQGQGGRRRKSLVRVLETGTDSMLASFPFSFPFSPLCLFSANKHNDERGHKYVHRGNAR
jgi:hypothetical protein